MHWSEDRGGILVVTHGSRRFEALLLALGLASFALAGVARFGGSGSERAGGLLMLAGFFFAGAVLSERSRFVFDPARRSVEWRRRFVLRERGGALPFDAIEAVELQTPVGDDGIPSRRVALVRREGGALPLVVGYRVDGDGEQARLARRLRELLGLPVEPRLDDELARLARSGRKIDAIKRVRTETGASLVDAKQRVDELAAPPN